MNQLEQALKALTITDDTPAVESEINWPLFCQDLGIRLLTSNSVRELYFPNKQKLGKFSGLPNKKQIERILQ